MARPFKDPALRMDVDLRVPLTAAQKALIVQAASTTQTDVATWVRPILIEAAQGQLASSGPIGKKRKQK
jgi:uncharacterized protein (DUF1778 family)